MSIFDDHRFMACIWAMIFFDCSFRALLAATGHIPFTVLPPVSLSLSLSVEPASCSALTLINIPLAAAFLISHWRRLEWKR